MSLTPQQKEDIGTHKDDILMTAGLMQALAMGCVEPVKVGNQHHIILPPGYQRQDITEAVEKAAAQPNRKRGTVTLLDVPSLVKYAVDQTQTTNGYIYADPDARTITAVFNDNKDALMPGWRDHRAVFKAEYTPEFDNWTRHNKQPKTQSEFAEFIEDNFADLIGEDGKNLLAIATTIQATTGINFSSAKRLQDGQTQLAYSETIDAKAGADGALKIPQTFALGLRIFKNGEGYKLTARLKYRLNGGAVKFWYELERPERAVEEAFKGYVTQVAGESGYVVLMGKP